jgi:hypothetical protein
MLRQGYHIVSYRPLCLWERQVASEAAFRGIVIKSLLVPTDCLHTIQRIVGDHIYPSVPNTVKGFKGTPWVYQYHNNTVHEVFGSTYAYKNASSTIPFLVYLPTNLKVGDTLLFETQELK